MKNFISSVMQIYCYWRHRTQKLTNAEGKWPTLYYLIVVSFCILGFMLFYWFFVPKGSEQWFMWGTCLAGWLFLIAHMPNSHYVYQAINFKRFFGFYPPSTPEEISAMQYEVDFSLIAWAYDLSKAYESEEVALNKLKRVAAYSNKNSWVYYIAKWENEACLGKKKAKERQKIFYPARDAAKDVGFRTCKKFRDYLTTRRPLFYS